MSKRLTRSMDNQVIAGVCGGVGEYFNVDPTWVRLLAVLLIFASGFGLVAYIVGWIVIPRGQLKTAATAEQPIAAARQREDASRRGPGFIPGVILVLLGMIFLFDHLFFWFDWDYVWPLALIGVGVVLVYHSLRPEPHRASNSETVEAAHGSR